MKYYISFILFSLFAMTFTSCNTDDLEKDIDALKDRVTSFETQVQQLNDEMNMIRILLDGNKTITDISINGDTYTLTLSNGETLTLTPGVVGGNYPSIEIGENGNWVIGGEDTGWRAEAEDGKDSTITPQFKIEANPADGGKKYWWVSYDEGATWTVLQNGLAQGTNNDSNPISGATVVGDNFKVTFGGQDYFIPIVKGLECAINVPEGVKDGVWSIAGGGASSFTVKVNIAEGDLVRVKAPIEWNAKVSSYAVGTKEVTVTVTPPVTPSECMIVVEVTHGVNTAADQIKAKTISDSNWAQYQAGFDVEIAGIVINKYDNPGGQLLQNGGKISADGVYFIASGATVDWTAGTGNLVVMPEKKNESARPSVNVATTSGLVTLTEGEIGVLFKEIRLFRSENMTSAYFFNTTKDLTLKKLSFEHCMIDLPENKSFSYLGNGGSIDEILMESCRVSIPLSSMLNGANPNLINLVNCNKGIYQSVIIRNNIFYSSADNEAAEFVCLMGSGVTNVKIENNTMINLLSNHGTTSGYLKISFAAGWTMKNNLIWYNVDRIPKVQSNDKLATFMAAPAAGAFEEENIKNNMVFAKSDTQLTWKYFRSSPPSGLNNNITPSTDNPFVDGSLVITEGKYTLKPEFKGIGATIE